MRKLFLLIIIYIVVVFSIRTANAKEFSPDKMQCSSYILIDSKNGQIIAEKNANTKVFPASTTKILTAIIAIESGNLERKLVASESAVRDIGRGGMNIGIVPGEELKLEDLLNALLVRSANETANIIADNLAPDRDDFMRYANKRATELGATNTNFMNPCGKDTEPEDVNHLSTAADLCLMARHALTLPKFREIVTKRTCKIPATNKFNQERYLGSTNKLLAPLYKSNRYIKITGIKTGTTVRAGSNLVSSAVDQSGTELISVILGVRGGNVFQLSKSLLEYGFQYLASPQLSQTGSTFKTIDFKPSTENVVNSLETGLLTSSIPASTQKIADEIEVESGSAQSLSTTLIVIFRVIVIILIILLLIVLALRALLPIFRKKYLANFKSIRKHCKRHDKKHGNRHDKTHDNL